MLTNDELATYEAGGYEVAGVIVPLVSRLAGELRAERTRTETLRAEMEKIASPRKDVSLGAWLIAQKALGALAASVEETP